MALVVKKTIRKFQEDKPGFLLNYKIVIVFRGQQKQVTGVVIKSVAVQAVLTAALVDINNFVISVVVPGQGVLFQFKIRQNKGLKLAQSFHSRKLQVYRWNLQYLTIPDRVDLHSFRLLLLETNQLG